MTKNKCTSKVRASQKILNGWVLVQYDGCWAAPETLSVRSGRVAYFVENGGMGLSGRGEAFWWTWRDHHVWFFKDRQELARFYQQGLKDAAAWERQRQLKRKEGS